MMPENTLLIVILVLLGAGVLAVIAYYLARFMRGTIKLALPRTTFQPGETIGGSFVLHAKKEIQGNRLLVRLIGTQVTKTFVDGKQRSRSHEIYRDEVVLEDAKTYPAGATADYEFAIATPDMNYSEFLNSQLGQALSTAFRLISNRSTYLKWKLEARLEAKGIDLAASKSVSINMKQQL